LDVNNSVTTDNKLSFNWRFIAAPLTVLVFSVLLTVIYYGQLPEEVAYSFDFDGEPNTYISSTTIVLILLGLQLLTLFISTIALLLIVNYIAFNEYKSSLWVKPQRLLTLMGNMPVIANAIFAFALLDIFTYNVSDTHLMPLWVFAIIVVVIGVILLGLFTVPVILRALRVFKEYEGQQNKE
jgi:uncharacterized membrane protein